MAGGNIIRFGAQLDDQVSQKLTGIRGAFDGLANSKGVGLIAQGFGIGAGIGVWNLASQAIGRATDFIKGSIDAASNLNETITKSQQIFGSAFDGVEQWSQGAAKAFGQSQRQALDMASTFAGLFQTVGIASDEAATSAQRMVELGSDLASFFNTDVAQAVGALRSGLAGESEPLRRFNVFLTETTLAAKAAEMGLTKVGGKLTEQQKIMARYAIIMEQTSAAQGDFERTSDGLANTQRSLSAQLEDTQAKLGEGLLPAVLAVTQAFGDLLTLTKDVNTAFANLSDTLVATNVPGADLLSTLLSLVPGGRLAVAATAEVSGGVDQMNAALVAVQDSLEAGTVPFNTAAQRMTRFGEEVSAAGAGMAEGFGTGRKLTAEELNKIAADMKAYKDRIVTDARDLVSKLKATFTLRGDWDTFIGDLNAFLDAFALTLGKGAERKEFDDWRAKLTKKLEAPMTGEARTKLLEDALNFTGDLGEYLSEGLADADPLIREGAKAALASIPELLNDLRKDSREYGTKSGKAYADGWTDSEGAITLSITRVLKKARRVIEASSPPGPESPLHEIDVWGENTGEAYGQGLAAGIMGSIPLVKGALGQMATTVATSLEDITKQTLAAMDDWASGMSEGALRRAEASGEDTRRYFEALVASGSYQWDIPASGGLRVSPTGTSSPDTLNPGAPPETLAPTSSGAPVVIKLTMDGREIAEVVDRNLFYRMKLGTTG